MMSLSLEARLLVQLENERTVTEFAEKTGALIVDADEKNPFKAVSKVFLEHDLIVLKKPIQEEAFLKRLATRFGYRYVSFKKETSSQEAATYTRTLLQDGPHQSSEIPSLSKKDAKELYDLMDQVDKIFEKHGLTYWAFAGTLLGAVRSQGLIPWDDDLDICIFESDEKKLLSLKNELEEQDLGLYYYEQKEFYKIFLINGTPIEDTRNPGALRSYCYPFVDIFVMGLPPLKEELDIYSHKSCFFFRNFPEESFTSDQLSHFHRIPFGPISIVVPKDAEEWLNRNYGVKAYPEFWKKFAMEPTRSHRLEAPISAYAGASYVILDDLAPAAWK